MDDAPPRFDRRFEPRHGEAVAIGDHVRRVTARNPGPFTFHGTNSFLIGRDEVAVIDPGPDDGSHVEALLSAIGSARVSAILITHGHRDHTGAAAALAAATGAPVLAGPARVVPDGGAGERLDAARDAGLRPDVILSDGARISGDGWTLEAIATPGHTADHLCFALAETATIFTGDHVMAWSTSIVAPPDGSMAAYMASLAKLAARPERRLLPAHGPGLCEATSAAYLAALAGHRRRREAALIAQLEAGPGTVPELVAAIYVDVDGSLHGAAALSLLAHVEDLVERGRIVGDGPLSLSTRFRLA
ncbi:MBL fold metallo-hydrolase [Siculibacillus lacustris]|uniref:MBL fold metallo-hydrolase n=1 Tax=Siculibacillus lacustris TaxID=1549641 RepID=A0A4Q9VHD2_9HYPH|nr:MBL fold metallo-hydrolase [Siculibacillus lacustris]TBW34523.1 MBL fold metallo-hydrolase [Siculibacillus lacustris]